MRKLEPDLDHNRPLPVAWSEYEPWLDRAWSSLLGADPTEPEVQAFLEAHPALLPGALGDIGPGGHHGPELDGVFREAMLQGLGKRRLPDFMWITRSTSLITPICIEIERPSKHWFNIDGTPTAHLTQARNQF